MEPINFEGLGICFYTQDKFRAPKKGEYYIVGMLYLTAWRAKYDYPYGSKFRIAVPTHKAVQTTAWVKGSPITAETKRNYPNIRIPNLYNK